MGKADVEPGPPPLPAASRRTSGSFFSALFLSMATLYFALKITLEITRTVKPIYMEAGTALPLVTVQAMALVEGPLRFGRLYLGVLPLIIAGCYVLLGNHARLRRAYLAALIATALLIFAALTFFLTLPLFSMSGPK